MRSSSRRAAREPRARLPQTTERILTHCLLLRVQLGAGLLKLLDLTLQPADPQAGGRELVFQLLEDGAGMFGQVRQLPQGPR